MSNTITINGHPVVLRHHSWQVIDRQIWSKTHIEMSGGSAYVGPYGGYINAPQLSSRVTERQEIWLRDAHGKEMPLRLNKGTFPVSVGHRVTTAGVEVNGQSWLVELHNVDTGSRKQMMPGWGQLLNQAGVLKRHSWSGLSATDKGLRVAGVALLSWLFAILILFNAAKVGIMPESQAEQLQDQLRTLNSQSIEAPDHKTRRAVEDKADSLRRELEVVSTKEQKAFLAWLNGLGITFTLGTILLLYKGVGRYRRKLAVAECQLEQALHQASQTFDSRSEADSTKASMASSA